MDQTTRFQPPSMEAESPLDMPRAVLHAPRQRIRKSSRGWLRATGVFFARFYVAVTTLALTAYGTWEMHGVISAGRPTVVQWIFLVLFSINFAWISFALTQTVLGFFRLLAMRLFPRQPATDPLTTRTAVLLPVYNEDPARVCSAALTMAEALDRDAPGHFAFFILSDTNRAEAWLEEEAAIKALMPHAPEGCPIHYRHRADNKERKAGNVGDWVSRWGGAYDHMIVLDADSVMSASTMIRLARRMEGNPDLGLIQTLPRIVGARTLYSRMQQFANRCYGPIYGNGLAVWQGRNGNFWGHNAIIRVEAFAAEAKLPRLPGKPPFGGHILSHDFAEAAFLRRAGWGVRIDTVFEETYEEAPPSLIDVILRDRRWCQGNLQHASLLFARGFTLTSRLHFITGIMAYMSALLWLLLVLSGLGLAAQVQLSQPEYFAKPSLFPTWPLFDSERAIELFILSMAVIITPKLLGLAAAFLSPRENWRFGGPIVLTLSFVWELILSILYAPIMMMTQSATVISVLRGSDSGWRPQRRGNGRVPFLELVVAHRWQVAAGLALALTAWLVHMDMFLWLLPVTAGLMLAVPLSWLSGMGWIERLGAFFGLGLTPEDRRPPEILAAYWDRLKASPDYSLTASPLQALAADPSFRDWHFAQLQLAPPRQLSAYSEDLFTALSKADRAENLDELESLLTQAQTLALLNHLPFYARFRALSGDPLPTDPAPQIDHDEDQKDGSPRAGQPV